MKRTNYMKLGLFVLLGLVLAGVAIIYFGSGLLGRSTVEYTTYFDESVEGLEVGALVRYRGVTLGQVTGMGIAPDHRHVRVNFALRDSDLERQGLAAGGGGGTRLLQAPGLRTQLALVGVTGQRILSLDVFDPATHPAPELPFSAPPNTIPSTPSLSTTLFAAAEKAADYLPSLVESITRVVGEGRGLLARLGGDGGPGTGQVLGHADRLLATMQDVASRFASSRAPEDVARTLADLDVAVRRLDRVLASLQGTRGLEDTLRQMNDTLAAVRRLADELERQPDALLKGRSGGGEP